MPRHTWLVFTLACALVPAPALAQHHVEPREQLPDYGVSVTPDGGTEPERAQNSSGHQATFTATNTGLNSRTFYFECWGTGGVTCTDFTPASAFLRSGQSRVVTATYSVGTANGELRLSAEGIAYDEGWRSVTTPIALTITSPQLTSDTTAVVYSRMPLVQVTMRHGDLDTMGLVVTLGSDTVPAW